jgi:hypothetical protein
MADTIKPSEHALTPSASAQDERGKSRPAKSLFVAAGHQGQRIVSFDGSAWAARQLGKEGEVYRAACCGNGRCVAVGSYGGSNIFACSVDGMLWKTSQKDAHYSQYIRGLGFGNGIFLGLGGDPGSVGDSKPFVVTSSDGIAWSDLTPITGKNILRRVVFGAGRFVGVGDRGRRATSTDGRSWQDAPDVKAIDTLVDIAFGKGLFVGVGLNGLRMTSEDGLKWSNRQVGEEGEHLNSIVLAGEQLVAVGMGVTFHSSDGIRWTRSPNKDAPLTVAFGNGVFVGLNWRGRILRSADAIQWRQVYKSDYHLEAIAFGSAT